MSQALASSPDQTGTATKGPRYAPQPLSDGNLVITGGGQNITGWTSVRVSVGIFRTPRDFEVSMSVRYPGDTRQPIPANSPITIAIAGQTVLTGYFERANIRLGPSSHDVSWSGRGRCCDLVDCAAILPNLSRTSSNIVQFATDLVAPFAGPIQIIAASPGSGKQFTYNISLGETVYEIIERMARFEGLLPYEDANGNLVLSQAGTVAHASGFTEGVNCQVIDYQFSYDERFSKYIPLVMTTAAFNADAQATNAAGAIVYDKTITRYRPRIIVSEQITNDQFLAELRAQYECNRRAGSSHRVTLTVDSWLDSAGMPWTPNMTAPIYLPSLNFNVTTWVITDVTYQRDGSSGTTAVVVLMDPAALAIQPEALNATDARTAADQASGSSSPVGDNSPATAAQTAPNANVSRTHEQTGGL